MKKETKLKNGLKVEVSCLEKRLEIFLERFVVFQLTYILSSIIKMGSQNYFLDLNAFKI